MYRRELAHVYDVFPCANLEETWQIFNLHEINVIVLEPDGLGYSESDLLKEIKSNSRNRNFNIPIIISSTKEVVDGNVKKEMAACLVKPVLPSALLLAIRDVLQFTPIKEVIQAN